MEQLQWLCVRQTNPSETLSDGVAFPDDQRVRTFTRKKNLGSMAIVNLNVKINERDPLAFVRRLLKTYPNAFAILLHCSEDAFWKLGVQIGSQPLDQLFASPLDRLMYWDDLTSTFTGWGRKP